MTDPNIVRLEQPWAGFSCLTIGQYKIGIAIGDEDGSQDPEKAGAVLENFIRDAKAALATVQAGE